MTINTFLFSNSDIVLLVLNGFVLLGRLLALLILGTFALEYNLNYFELLASDSKAYFFADNGIAVLRAISY